MDRSLDIHEIQQLLKGDMRNSQQNKKKVLGMLRRVLGEGIRAGRVKKRAGSGDYGAGRKKKKAGMRAHGLKGGIKAGRKRKAKRAGEYGMGEILQNNAYNKLLNILSRGKGIRSGLVAGKKKKAGLVAGKKKKASVRAKNPWLSFVAKFRKAHPRLKGPELFERAGAAYRKSQ